MTSALTARAEPRKCSRPSGVVNKWPPAAVSTKAGTRHWCNRAASGLYIKRIDVDPRAARACLLGAKHGQGEPVRPCSKSCSGLQDLLPPTACCAVGIEGASDSIYRDVRLAAARVGNADDADSRSVELQCQGRTVDRTGDIRATAGTRVGAGAPAPLIWALHDTGI